MGDWRLTQTMQREHVLSHLAHDVVDHMTGSSSPCGYGRLPHRSCESWLCLVVFYHTADPLQEGSGAPWARIVLRKQVPTAKKNKNKLTVKCPMCATHDSVQMLETNMNGEWVIRREQDTLLQQSQITSQVTKKIHSLQQSENEFETELVICQPDKERKGLLARKTACTKPK